MYTLFEVKSPYEVKGLCSGERKIACLSRENFSPNPIFKIKPWHVKINPLNSRRNISINKCRSDEYTIRAISLEIYAFVAISSKIHYLVWFVILDTSQCYDFFLSCANVFTAAPRFSITPEEMIYVNLGDSIILNCQAEGTPEPEILWYKDANPVEPSTTIGIHNSGTELRFVTIKNEDIGDYTCIARNGEGQISHTARVIIAGEISTICNHNLLWKKVSVCILVHWYGFCCNMKFFQTNF